MNCSRWSNFTRRLAEAGSNEERRLLRKENDQAASGSGKDSLATDSDDRVVLLDGEGKQIIGIVQSSCISIATTACLGTVTTTSLLTLTGNGTGLTSSVC